MIQFARNTQISRRNHEKSFYNDRVDLRDRYFRYISRTSQGKFSTNIADMTNVATPVKAKTNSCLDVTNPAADAEAITVTVHNTTSDGLCAQVWSLPGLANISRMISTNNGTLKFGGMGIKY